MDCVEVAEEMIDKAEYVEYLRGLLCTIVPCQFYVYDSCWKDNDNCHMCRDFIDLPRVRFLPAVAKLLGRDYKKPLCPCHELGKEALVRAAEAIARWDKGEHKWQR